LSSRDIVAAVLCGGEGSRLRPLTYYFQKAMIPIGSNQKPLLEYIVMLLKSHGIQDVVLLAGYKHEQIENYFADGSRFDVRVKYSLDAEGFRGSGWALLNAHRSGLFEGFEHILVYYGDILSNIDLKDMARQHIETCAHVTLAVSRGYRLPVGVVELDGLRVVDVREKPTVEAPVGIGILLLRAETLEVLEGISEKHSGMELDLMSHLLPELTAEGKPVYAYTTERFWYDVGSTEKYEKLDNNVVDKLFEGIKG
jgi:mannose-1-phosphate guanylyltransferase